MAYLKFLALATTLILAAAADTVRADFQEDEYELYKLLQEAILTERNMYAMQQAFYPVDSFTVAEVYFNVTVQAKYINEEEKYYFTFDYYECHCYKRHDQIRVVTNSMPLQSYIEGFMPYLHNYSDTYFYNLLDMLTKAQYSYYKYYSTTELKLYLTEINSYSDYIKGLQVLLTRVSFTNSMRVIM